MTTCPHNKHGCKMMQHPDDQTRWYCPQCGKKLIEDPGFPFIILIMGMMIAVVVVLKILPSNADVKNPSDSQTQSSQVSPNTQENNISDELSINE